MGETFVFVVICMIEANLLTWLFVKVRPGWSRRRVSMISALPLPLLMWSICIFLFVDSMLASKEECGVDACGMVAAFSLFGASIGLAGFVFGGVASFFTYKLANRSAVRRANP